MLQIELKKELPIIKMNFEEVKVSIEESMRKYKGLVVTEDELSGCKATQKQLAGYRLKLDAYRKDVKKEMSKPISKFEDDCKVLIKLIEDAEMPIKEGIAVFDQKKRDEKRVEAEEIIKQAIEEHKLREKYGDMLVVLDRYTNLSAKTKDTKIDIDQRAFILLQDQIREDEAVKLEEKRKLEILEIAKSTIEESNQYIKSKMQIEDFSYLINAGISASEIIKEINKMKQRIIVKETPKPVVESVEIPAVNISPVMESPREANIELPTKLGQAEEKIYFVEMRVEATREKIAMLSQFLKENKYEYNVEDKGLAQEGRK